VYMKGKVNILGSSHGCWEQKLTLCESPVTGSTSQESLGISTRPAVHGISPRRANSTGTPGQNRLASSGRGKVLHEDFPLPVGPAITESWPGGN